MNIPERESILNMLISIAPDLDHNQCLKFEKQGLMKFIGDKKNPKWTFTEENFSGMNASQMMQVYAILNRGVKLRKLRDALS